MRRSKRCGAKARCGNCRRCCKRHARCRAAGRLVVAALEEADRDTLRDAAGWLAAHDDVIALLSAPQAEARPVLFARGARMREDMAALLRACGAKGGGRDDFAQGSALSEDCLQQAAARLLSRDGETNTPG